MKKTVPIVVSGGMLLLVIAVATPALGNTPLDRLVCSPRQNDGSFVNGICILQQAQQGQPYEGFILTSRGAGGTFAIISGTTPPGLGMPTQYGAAGTIVAGTPTRQGTLTFTVRGIDQQGHRLSPQTYRITVEPPPPLRVESSGGCQPGTVGVGYTQFFFVDGGTPPWIWALDSGSFPPGLHLTSPNGPIDQNDALTGTPTAAGSSTFTMRVTDSLGTSDSASPCTIAIGRS